MRLNDDQLEAAAKLLTYFGHRLMRQGLPPEEFNAVQDLVHRIEHPEPKVGCLVGKCKADLQKRARLDLDRRKGGWGRPADPEDICPKCLRVGTLKYEPGFGVYAENVCECGYKEAFFY